MEIIKLAMILFLKPQLPIGVFMTQGNYKVGQKGDNGCILLWSEFGV